MQKKDADFHPSPQLTLSSASVWSPEHQTAGFMLYLYKGASGTRNMRESRTLVQRALALMECLC